MASNAITELIAQVRFENVSNCPFLVCIIQLKKFALAMKYRRDIVLRMRDQPTLSYSVSLQFLLSMSNLFLFNQEL